MHLWMYVCIVPCDGLASHTRCVLGSCLVFLRIDLDKALTYRNWWISWLFHVFIVFNRLPVKRIKLNWCSCCWRAMQCYLEISCTNPTDYSYRKAVTAQPSIGSGVRPCHSFKERPRSLIVFLQLAHTLIAKLPWIYALLLSYFPLIPSFSKAWKDKPASLLLITSQSDFHRTVRQRSSNGKEAAFFSKASTAVNQLIPFPWKILRCLCCRSKMFYVPNI